MVYLSYFVSVRTLRALISSIIFKIQIFAFLFSSLFSDAKNRSIVWLQLHFHGIFNFAVILFSHVQRSFKYKRIANFPVEMALHIDKSVYFVVITSDIE